MTDTSRIKPIPEGYHSVTPYLVVKDAARAIEFYTKAFGAKEIMRMPAPGGKIGHAELTIGDSHIMLSDEWPDMGALAPQPGTRVPVSLALYVEDSDGTVDRAVKAGAKIVRAVENQFYGDRSGQIEDPSGHTWTVGTHIEDVSPEEMAKRAKALFGG